MIAVALVLALPGVGLADLGFRWPDLAGVDRFGLTDGVVSASTVAGMVTGLLLGTVVMALVMRRSRQRAARRPGGEGHALAQPARGQLAAILPMLPRTRAGRHGWAHLSLSAGITEEITYRGLILLTLGILLPTTTSQLTVVVAAAALFGIAHVYQGWTGVLSTGLMGGVLAGLYLSTGSLLVPVVLHVLVDLRALLVPVPAPTGADEGPTCPAAPTATRAPATPSPQD